MGPVLTQSSQLQSYDTKDLLPNSQDVPLEGDDHVPSRQARCPGHEAHAAGRFVWGKEGFKWMSDDKSSASQDQSSESLSSTSGGAQQSQIFSSQAPTEGLQGFQPQPSW